MRVAEIRHHSVVDGPGVRTAVLLQGCPHHCPGCYNPLLWPPEGGREMSVGEVLCEIGKGLSSGDCGVTLTGGEPLAQPEEVARLCIALRGAGVHIIVYTGYRYEDLLEGGGPAVMAILQTAHVLVDGPFIRSLHDPGLPYRGSSNQRVIDLPASLRAGRGVLLHWERDEPVSILPDGSVVMNCHHGTASLVRALGKAEPYLNCGQLINQEE